MTDKSSSPSATSSGYITPYFAWTPTGLRQVDRNRNGAMQYVRADDYEKLALAYATLQEKTAPSETLPKGDVESQAADMEKLGHADVAYTLRVLMRANLDQATWIGEQSKDIANLRNELAEANGEKIHYASATNELGIELRKLKGTIPSATRLKVTLEDEANIAFLRQHDSKSLRSIADRYAILAAAFKDELGEPFLEKAIEAARG